MLLRVSGFALGGYRLYRPLGCGVIGFRVLDTLRPERHPFRYM